MSTSPPQAFLLTSQRQLISTVAKTMVFTGASVVTLFLVLMIMVPDARAYAAYPLMIALVVVGSVGTLRLLPRLTLSYAMVPLIAVIVGGILFSSSMFRETTLIVVPFLFIVVVLSSVGQHTTIAFTSGLICLAIGIILAVTAPRPVVATTELSLGFALPLVNAAGTITTITVVWLISLRLVGTTRTALALAEQRTQEAEHARAEAESKTAALIAQNQAQQRLLALVALLETPAIPIADDVVLLPLIGHFDTRRAAELTKRVLETVHRRRVRFVIMDVTGISVLDTLVVASLMQTIQAVRLLGAQVIMCGVQAAVATTLVQLRLDLSEVPIVQTPQAALHLITDTQRAYSEGIA